MTQEMKFVIKSSFKGGIKDGLQKGIVNAILETPIAILESMVVRGVYTSHPVKGMENIYDPCLNCPHRPKDGDTSSCNCTTNGNRAYVKMTWENFPLEKKLKLLRKWGYSRDDQLRVIDNENIIGWMFKEFPDEAFGLLKIAKYSDKNVRIFLQSLGY